MRYVFDLDGTICEAADPAYPRDYINAKPVWPMIEKMREIAAVPGNSITIYTARGMTQYDGDFAEAEKQYDDMTRNWLEDHGVPYDVLMFGKPSGDIYVDDKSVTPQEFLHHAE